MLKTKTLFANVLIVILFSSLNCVVFLFILFSILSKLIDLFDLQVLICLIKICPENKFSSLVAFGFCFSREFKFEMLINFFCDYQYVSL